MEPFVLSANRRDELEEVQIPPQNCADDMRKEEDVSSFGKVGNSNVD
jgi:hypothetical protein